jgi:ribosomal protein L37E
MRKRYHDKKSSCALCHPNKRGWEYKWSNKEMVRIKEWEKEKDSMATGFPTFRE